MTSYEQYLKDRQDYFDSENLSNIERCEILDEEARNYNQ